VPSEESREMFVQLYMCVSLKNNTTILYPTVIYLKCKPIANSSYQKQNLEEIHCSERRHWTLAHPQPRRAQTFKRWEHVWAGIHSTPGVQDT